VFCWACVDLTGLLDAYRWFLRRSSSHFAFRMAPCRLVYERMKLVIEPSAGVGLAAVLSPAFREAVGPDCKNVGVILCGGNVDLGRFMELMHEDAAKHSQ
jgi:hypothetical protein